jgi:copper chaperone CopZ
MLRVNIHCDGCEKKVKKTLHKIDGTRKKNSSFAAAICLLFVSVSLSTFALRLLLTET